MEENQTYVGSFPDIHYYSPDTMSGATRIDFYAWYPSQEGQQFDFQHEMLTYCRWRMNINKSQLTYANSLPFFNNLIADPTKNEGPRIILIGPVKVKRAAQFGVLPLIFKNNQTLNFESIKHLVCSLDRNATIPLNDDAKITPDAKRRKVFNVQQTKLYRIVYDKRFKNDYVKAVTARPNLLVYDGHVSHLSIELVETATEWEVTILKLPAHSSHMLQPLDVFVFCGIKSAWDAKLTDWARHNVNQKLPKSKFADLLGETWRNLQPCVIQSGFRKCGIYD
ncbi:hypothetical protein AVEN_125809-1 [Araneus ventricosus]|uniref:DDE-1 domain-containing protein n=1 Tax=Araneus ventricosus TaxID=182803 RepID=A0A4Y2RW61_ARAVE|nr:hypothetical protein AVEN_125809-1 [Araneus ventricosus]